MYGIYESLIQTLANAKYRTTKCPSLITCVMCSLVAGFLLLSANLYNPTILPVPLRFSPSCNKLSPRPALSPTSPQTQINGMGASNNKTLMEQLHFNSAIIHHKTTTSSSPHSGGEIIRFSYPTPIQRGYDHFNSHSWMPRFNDIETHHSAISLLANISELFTRANITYTLIHGTLLGSFMFHDLIPWDDDLDILVSFKDINRVKALLRDPHIRHVFGTNSYRDNYNTFEMPYVKYDADPSNPDFCGNHPDLKDEICKHTFHFYRLDSPKTLNRRIGYPYVDIQFYTENDTHVWSIDARSNDPLVYEKSDFYPMHRRPFFNLWLPAPHRTRKVLKMKFDKFKCASKWYSHHTQTIAIGYQSKCSYITNCYPYVKRLPQCSGTKGKLGVIEQLVIGDTVIHEVVMAEEYYHDLEPFEL